MWPTLRTCLRDAGRSLSGLVVSLPGGPRKAPLCVVAAITIDDHEGDGSNHVILLSPSQHRNLERLMYVEGAVIGVGMLPARRRPIGRPPHARASDGAELDPAGRAFVTCKGGHVAELGDGWRYVCGVCV